MKNKDFNSIISRLAIMTRGQLERAAKALSNEASARDCSHSLHECEPDACRHCGSPSIVRNGSQRGLQRWLCKDCLKSSCATTGTPLNRLHGKGLFGLHSQALCDGATLRQVRDRLGISLSRALRWRHRFLAMPSTHQPRGMGGVVEVDEIYMKVNRKGERGLGPTARKRGGMMKGKGKSSRQFVPVLVARARSGPLVADRVLANMSKEEIAAGLAGRIDPASTVLCMDSHKSFMEMGVVLGVPTNIFVTRKKKESDLHVQNVNGYHERIRTWIDRMLRGVASKNLHLYLGWMRMKWWWKDCGMMAGDVLKSALGRQLINSN